MAGFTWPLPGGLDDGALEAALFPAQAPSRVPRPEPDCAYIHRELQRHKGVTLRLLWLESGNGPLERLPVQPVLRPLPRVAGAAPPAASTDPSSCASPPARGSGTAKPCSSAARPDPENPSLPARSATKSAASASRRATTASRVCSTNSPWSRGTVPTPNLYSGLLGRGSSSSNDWGLALKPGTA